MTITSREFADGQAIPARFTCEGQSSPPPLALRGAPPKARSLALLVTDPDAPGGTFTHWLVWNIPPSSPTVAGMLGTNDFGNVTYGAPCPPSGEHRYIFTLYALDTELTLPSRSKRADVERAMQGHVIAQAVLTGKYRKGGSR